MKKKSSKVSVYVEVKCVGPPTNEITLMTQSLPQSDDQSVNNLPGIFRRLFRELLWFIG